MIIGFMILISNPLKVVLVYMIWKYCFWMFKKNDVHNKEEVYFTFNLLLHNTFDKSYLAWYDDIDDIK